MIVAAPLAVAAMLPIPVNALFAVTQVPTATPQICCCLQVTEADPLDFPTELEREPVPVSALVPIDAAPFDLPTELVKAPVPVRVLVPMDAIPLDLPTEFEREPVAVSVLVVMVATPVEAEAIRPLPVKGLFAVVQVPIAVPQTFCCLQVTEAEPLIFPTEFESEPVAVSVLVVIEAAPAEVPAKAPVAVSILVVIEEAPAEAPANAPEPLS